jgi:nitroreductase
LEALSRSKARGSAFLNNAPLAIVICADPDKSDVWVEDASIAAIYVHLAAVSLGLGSCWIQIRKRQHDGTKMSESYVRETLNVPARIRVESIVAVGYPDEEKPPHKKDELLYERIHFNAFGQKHNG